jgi:hypothetical protein
LLASRASFLELTDAPAWILAGFMILAIHGIILVLLAKIFHLDMFTCGVASLANIGGSASAPILAGAYSGALVPVGVLMALAFSVFKIPYGSLVGVLTAICAIIPYVGALISCVVSVFLVLLVDPVLAVRCLIVYLAVQFVENQFIYPRVVGKSVGLSPLYTLIAAMIGGKLFGIIGIIFFIPLTAVVIELVKEDTFRRLRAKEPLQ